MDYERELTEAVKVGLQKAVADKLGGYNSPLDKMLAGVIDREGEQLRTLLTTAIQSAIGDDAWRDHIGNAIRGKLAAILIQRFGGELERQVNALKSDPVTRARITQAIDEIIKAQLK